ncbi:hypothetical protein T492DRAFT_942369, partial [Pavlovales sp. CCMP2436]
GMRIFVVDVVNDVSLFLNTIFFVDGIQRSIVLVRSHPLLSVRSLILICLYFSLCSF